jgi:histidyl-tRNA synthetase
MAEKPKKPQKLKARLPRGLADRGPAEIAATRAMAEKIREVFERYGFEPVETPAMEYTDALGKFLPDQDRPNEGVFSFQDDDEQWISLRYDLTAPLARYVAENFDHLPKPYRSYRAGYVYRNEKPGPGRFRQFMQFDADTVGSASPAADAEMCMMAADTMEKLGVPADRFVVKFNNRKLLDGLLEYIGLAGPENASKRLIVLRAIDKVDRIGAEGTNALLRAGRKDESGDFTKGANLSDFQIEIVLWFVGGANPRFDNEKSYYQKFGIAEVAPNQIPNYGKGFLQIENNERIARLRYLAQQNSLFQNGLDELEEIAQLTKSIGYDHTRISFDCSVVRGLEYYTGPIFEVELLAPIPNEKGQPVVFGSVGGGGRYDGLVSRFRGQPVPATGFSIGVSRLQAALTRLGKIDTRPAPGPVVVTVFGGNIADYQRFVTMLREANIPAELYLGNPKNNLGVQFKYADRRNSPCVVVQGSDEKARGDVVIKDLIMGTEAALFHGAVGTSRADYLEERPAQFSCKEEELVAKVREVLARHDVNWG